MMEERMRFVLTALAAAAILAAQVVSAAPGDPERAARAWLALIDHGRYAESWSSAGAIFRAHVSSARWTHQAALARSPLGPVVSRNFAGDEPSTSLPGAPDAIYDQVHFSTVFAHKASATETAVMTRQKDGWRVDGYWVR
jgi:hypothetical protein